jgi:hypothetical protein
MQIFLTVISGVLVYVLGQAVLHFVFEPIKEVNKQRGDTSFLLLSYRHKITNASNKGEKLQRDIKEMGAALVSTMWQIPFYSFLSSLTVFGLPTKDDVLKAAQEINGISWGMGPIGSSATSAIENYKALKEIAGRLKIKTSFD